MRKRPIVALHEDGSMAGWFESAAACHRLYGIPRDAIWKSIKTGKPYRNFRWVYKEVYDEHYRKCTLHELSYQRDRQRDAKGHWVKGHQPIRHSAQTKRILAEHARQQSHRQAADPTSNWGRGVSQPVWCATNNREYSSITEAAADLGLTPHQISVALHGRHRTKGYKFIKTKKT